MCKLCNLFSPSQSELLSHVSQKHSEDGTKVDEIVVLLKPLTTPTNPNKNGEGTRPKSAKDVNAYCSVATLGCPKFLQLQFTRAASLCVFHAVPTALIKGLC